MKNKTAHRYSKTNKTIEELKYYLLYKRATFRNLIIEQEFYKTLLSAPIYKTHYPNLFEKIEIFKNAIEKSLQQSKLLLNEIGMQLFQIDKSSEGIHPLHTTLNFKEFENLEHDIYCFLMSITTLKLDLFQYLPEVIITE